MCIEYDFYWDKDFNLYTNKLIKPMIFNRYLSLICTLGFMILLEIARNFWPNGNIEKVSSLL